jgi:hypothetical protein
VAQLMEKMAQENAKAAAQVRSHDRRAQKAPTTSWPWPLLCVPFLTYISLD